ncbi:hypothetical protein LWI28_025587 [Acer negundo]|uniref:Uncharacterized protein n=1 Tax=Acer negundo TaxID=4023 RepID=A0AAD5P479_ACENE|nr:hypothetical protein LWI28_025587 [Acer negundo]
MFGVYVSSRHGLSLGRIPRLSTPFFHNSLSAPCFGASSAESSSDDSLSGFEAEGGFWSNTLGSNLAGEGPSLLKTQAGCSLKAQVLASGVAYEGRLCIFGNISKLVGMVDPLAESLSGKDLPGQPNPRLDVMSTEAGLGPSLPLLLEDVVHPCKGDGIEDRHESEVGFGDIMRS